MMMSSPFVRWGGPAAMLGGALWFLSYTLQILVGVTGGESLGYENPSAVSRAGELFFHGGFVFLGLALLAIHGRLGGRSKWLGRAGAVFACLAIAIGVINPVLRLQEAGFLGVLGVVLGGLLLGIAARRVGALPGRASLLLLLVGIGFFPLIILTIPLESVLPSYAAADFPFAIAGALWVAAGVMTRAGGTSEAERRVVAAV